MRRIIIYTIITIGFILLFSKMVFSQKIGSIVTNFDTVGWDTPASFSTYYQLAYYRLLSNPGGWVNLNTQKVDSLLHALVVYTDTKQMQIRNDTLIISDSLSGKGSFLGTDTSVTIAVSNLDSLDVVIVTPEGSAQGNILSVYPHAGSFDVRRLSAGAVNALKFNWIWIRKYQ